MNVQVRIPGKLMLSGEYAALKGGAVLATVLPLYLQVDLAAASPRDSNDVVTVTSDLWSKPKTLTLEIMRAQSHDDALHHALYREFTRVPALQERHWTLAIRSDFPPSYGFGSSTALRLALHLGFAGPSRNADRLNAAKTVYQDQRDFQGRASGYDIYTQAMGQTCVFQCAPEAAWPGTSHTSLTDRIPTDLWAFVGGSGADTKQAIGSVTEWLDQNQLWTQLLGEQDTLTRTFETGGESLIHAMAKVRRFFLQGPKGLPKMEQILAAVPGLDSAWSWKMTGAGGEDALLIYAPGASFAPVNATLTNMGWKPIPVPKMTATLSIKDTP